MALRMEVDTNLIAPFTCDAMPNDAFMMVPNTLLRIMAVPCVCDSPANMPKVVHPAKPIICPIHCLSIMLRLKAIRLSSYLILQ